MRAEAMVVIASDNMDWFARAFHRARHPRRRRVQPRETLADRAVICDDTICSSDVAALKADDPQAFFGPWLDRHGVGFPDAVLIDDRAGNCAAFTNCGGTAIRWKTGASDISEIVSALKSWLDTAGPTASSQVNQYSSRRLLRALFRAACRWWWRACCRESAASLVRRRSMLLRRVAAG